MIKAGSKDSLNSAKDKEKEIKKIIDLKESILNKEKDLEESIELSKLLKAELENVKKRHKKEIADAHNYAIKDFSKKLLSILDSIEDGISHIKKNNNMNINDIKDGLHMTHKMFVYLLKDFEISEIETENQTFNPEYHEAISIIKDKKAKDNTILSTIQKGYTINKRVLRTSKVVVCKNN